MFTHDNQLVTVGFLIKGGMSFKNDYFVSNTSHKSNQPPIASITAKTPCAVVKDLAVEFVSLIKSLYIKPKELTCPMPAI